MKQSSRRLVGLSRRAFLGNLGVTAGRIALAGLLYPDLVRALPKKNGAGPPAIARLAAFRAKSPAFDLPVYERGPFADRFVGLQTCFVEALRF